MIKIQLLLAIAFIWQALSYAESAPPPDITEISAAKRAFENNSSRKNYKVLFAALEAYDDEVTVETVEAYLTLLSVDAQQGRYRQLRQTALAAEAHFEPVSEMIPRQYLDTKSVAAIALFNDTSRPEAMLEMAHVVGRASQIHNEDWTHPEWADQIRWRGEAWLYAMGAFFDSHRSGNPYEQQTSEIIASYELEHHESPNTKKTVEHTLPHCRGEMEQKPRMRYPIAAQLRGAYGAVILGFELDEAGNVQEVDVKASVPFEDFKDKAAKTVSQWRFIPDASEAPGETCRLASKNVVIPVTFVIR